MVSFETVGHGPAGVLVLHGWFGDHDIWKPTYPLLDVDRFTYAFVDYRGYGASRDMPGPYSMAQISADAQAVARQLGWDRYAVVGHSMGGMAAQRLGIDDFERVSAIVAVTPVPASGVPLPPDAMALFESAATSDDAAAAVIDGSLGSRLTPALTRLILDHKRQTVGPKAFAAYFQAFANTDFSSEAASLKSPLLVLVGEHDGGVSEDFVRATFPKLYPHGSIVVLPNAGHYPMIETPAFLVTMIERFLIETRT